MKPKHRGGYTTLHADLCERTLVTLLRGLGPWKSGVYLAGGLVPRYLISHHPDDDHQPPPHAGTTDVDLVLDLHLLSGVDAYRRLEQNLKALGLERGTNEAGNAQHFSWRKPVGGGITVVVDLLCEASDQSQAGRVTDLPGERRLSALQIPGAHLVLDDYREVQITAELLEERGQATEIIRVANIVPFIVLKALAYDDRFEEKDAYDIIYCLMHFGRGPEKVAGLFADRLQRWPDEPLLSHALHVLRTRFASDSNIPGYRKDGPTSYARFLANPGQPDLNARNQQDAAAVIDLLLRSIYT